MKCASAIALLLLLITASAPASEILTYRGQVGRVTEYLVTTKATGYQVSLGERKPISVEAEYQVREEVLSCDPDGTFHLQVSGHTAKVKDPTHAFGNQQLDLMPVQMQVSPNGEILRTSAVTPSGLTTMRENAVAALLAQSLPVVTPSGPVAPGESWEWRSGDVVQTNRLVELVQEEVRLARISGTARGPLALSERSEALGLTTNMTGMQTQTSTLDFDLGLGIPRRHKGNLALQTNTEVQMESAQGLRAFQIRMNLRVEFDSRLVRLDGRPL